MSEPKAEPFSWGPERVSPRQLRSSSFITVVIAVAYLYGIVHFSRESLLFEAVLSLALPVAAWRGGWLTEPGNRLTQLLVFETLFNLLAILNQAALRAGMESVATLCGWAFVGWFGLQLFGFLAYAKEHRRWHGVVQSLILFTLIMGWLMQCDQMAGRLDDEGRFLMWGEDSPLVLRVGYAVWFVNAVLGDLPDIHLRQFLLQGTSVVLSFLSGEFFHVRLLTACHLFLLDLIFAFGKLPSPVPPDTFAQLTVPTRRWFYDTVRPRMSMVGSITMVGILVWALVGGL